MNSARRRFRGGRRTWLATLTTILLLALAGSCGRGVQNDGPAATGGHPIILVVVDALRADHLGTYGYERPTSPSLDAWADRGRVFEHAWTASPWTLPSFGSILTGQLPSTHLAGSEVADDAGADFEVVAARNFVKLAAGVPTIAERLAAEGFATGAFVANPFLDPRFGLDRGFTDYDHHDTSNSELRPAGEVIDRALTWIDETAGRPFFLMVHLFDPHLDYDAPAPFRGRFTEPAGEGLELPVQGLWPIRNRLEEMTTLEREFIVAAYDEEVAYVDAELGRFLEALEARGILQEALVLLTADHGEEFFEHGGFEHGHSMYQEVLHVPLILWGPEVGVGRDPMPVSLIDVAPTIMEASGTQRRDAAAAAINAADDPAINTADDPASAPMAGISLLESARASRPEARDIIAERILYGPETKVIVNWPYKAILEVESSRAMLFDLSSDAAEQRDLAAEQPDRLRALLGRLAEVLARARTPGAGTEAEVDPDLLRRLRALGYIR